MISSDSMFPFVVENSIIQKITQEFFLLTIRKFRCAFDPLANKNWQDQVPTQKILA
jgi:hypothetical protein